MPGMGILHRVMEVQTPMLEFPLVRSQPYGNLKAKSKHCYRHEHNKFMAGSTLKEKANLKRTKA